MIKSLTFITSNPSKVEQLKRHLTIPIEHQDLTLPEIQSLDLEEIVQLKAEAAYAHIKNPIIVEDTSLIFHALGKLPGPFIKWFYQELGNEGLIELINAYPNRNATVDIMYGLHTGTEVVTFKGQTQGSIADTPRGKNGFSWDPIFIPNGQTKTTAEMNQDEQKQTSARRIALNKLETYLMQV